MVFFRSMKLDIKKLPQSEVEMLFELDPKEWGEFVLEAGKELGREVKIDGFRPGQAPPKLVEQKVGTGHILERAADLAVRRNFIQAIKENNLEPIAPPQVQVLKIAAENPFEFKIKITVSPEVKLGDYFKIARTRKKSGEEIKVADEEVEKSLKWLLKSRTKFVAVQRPAQKGDLVEAEFSMSREGNDIPNGEVKNYSAVLGEGLNFAPGFEEQILGLKENEEKSFSLLFPEDWLEKEMAGRLIDFKLKMKSVQEGQTPELSDEFAKNLGEFKDLEALKESIKDGLRHEKEHKEKDLWRLETLKEIAKKSEAQIPPILLEAEKEKMLAEMEQNLAQMGLQFEKYLEDIKKTKDELKKEWSAKAEERVMAALILRQIAQKENLQVSEEELEKEANVFLSRFQSAAQAEGQIDKERLKEYIKGSLLNEKAFRLLEDFSKQA